jgi:hypothetical protein
MRRTVMRGVNFASLLFEDVMAGLVPARSLSPFAGRGFG